MRTNRRWRRSSRCAADSPQCVEVAGDHAALRDSKNPAGGVLAVPEAALDELLDRLRRS